jgi:hypothetical protein
MRGGPKMAGTANALAPGKCSEDDVEAVPPHLFSSGTLCLWKKTRGPVLP